MIFLVKVLLLYVSWGHDQTPKLSLTCKESPTVVLSCHVKFRENY